MTTLANTIHRGMSRIDGLSLRERTLLTLTLLLITTLGWYYPFFEPQKRQILLLDTQLTTLKKSLHSLRELAQKAHHKATLDPNLHAQQEIERLKKENRQLDRQLLEQGQQWVSPSRQIQIEKQILAQQGPLVLLDIQRLPRQTLADSPQNKKNTSLPPPPLFRQPLQFTWQGSYLHAWRHLKELEQADLAVNWERLLYQTDQPPQGLFTLQLSTIQLQE
ncbi:MAG: hypothetical protein HQL72_15130 [Magnetococcales bacterium]|nr:hypothetical protein [Magnetococcales bacterium]